MHLPAVAQKRTQLFHSSILYFFKYDKVSPCTAFAKTNMVDFYGNAEFLTFHPVIAYAIFNKNSLKRPRWVSTILNWHCGTCGFCYHAVATLWHHMAVLLKNSCKLIGDYLLRFGIFFYCILLIWLLYTVVVLYLIYMFDHTNVEKSWKNYIHKSNLLTMHTLW